MMCQRVAGGSEPDHEDVLAVVGKWIRSVDVERIPTRQKAVDLDAPRQIQRIGENSCFNLRNVDWILLLINAGFHAVVADPVSRTWTHWIADHYQCQRSNGVAIL